MDLGLSGKIALVTGGSAGIGRGIARVLAAEGASLMLAARSRDALEAACADITAATGAAASWVVVDLETVEGPGMAVDATIAEFGRIDILVNNGAPTAMGGLDDFDERGYAAELDGKAIAYVRSARRAVPAMRARGNGVIVNIAGMAARHATGSYLVGTMAVKAIHGLTKSLADELAGSGIRVVCVDPGVIDTDRFRVSALAEYSRKTGKSPKELAGEIQDEIPLGRFGDPADIGAAVAFLASERAGYITGVTLLVDGGRSRSVP